MIKINKGKQPKCFNNIQSKIIKNDLSIYYSLPLKSRSQSRPPHDIVGYIEHFALDQLFQEFNHKCAYCETKVNSGNFSSIKRNYAIDFYRPQNDAADLEGIISVDHYWWLALDWKNILLCCRECVSNKRNYFPVRKKRANSKFKNKTELRLFEDPLILDPTSEKVQNYFKYDLESGEILPLTQKGEFTIKLLGLNRHSLLRGRRETASELNEDIFFLNSDVSYLSDKIRLEKLQELSDKWQHILNLKSDYPFCGFARYFLIQKFNRKEISLSKSISETNDLRSLFMQFENQEIISFQFYKEVKDHVLYQPLYLPIQINSFQIHNFKGIEKIDFQLSSSKYRTPCLGIIGENGVGKSSILSGIIKTLLGSTIDYAKINNDDVSVGKDECFTYVSLKNIDSSVTCNYSLKNHRVNYQKHNYNANNHAIMAFGPFRHSQDSGGQERNFKNAIWAHNFFKPYAPLRSAYKWLFTLNDQEFDLVALSILDLLLLTNKANLLRYDDDIWVEDKVRIKLSQLSDGYKSMISLGCNIMEGLFKTNQDMKNASGLVVIDELGANLHPRWKMLIMKRFRTTFPYVQFIISTHDPLCLKGFDEGEVILVKENEFGKSEIISNLPSPDAYRVDELLTSPMFGLSSTIDPEIESDMVEYYDLLSRSSLSKSELNRLDILKSNLKEQNHLGDSYRENLLYVAIDTILAQKRTQFNFKDIEKEVAKKALEILDKYNIF
jgi:predicted ATPase